MQAARILLGLAILGAGALPGASVSEETAAADAAGSAWYLGVAAGALLPGNGNTLGSGADVRVRIGRYASEFWALEADAGCAPSVHDRARGDTSATTLAAQGLFHLTGCQTFDRLFGCERFDPFVTAGAAARFAGHDCFADGSHRTALGPCAGFGAFYHLTDALSLRADARAQLCCDTPAGMLYDVSVGLQYTFGALE